MAGKGYPVSIVNVFSRSVEMTSQLPTLFISANILI